MIEGLSLDEIKAEGLERFIHTPQTDKYLHKVDGGESAQEMEHRVLPRIMALQEAVSKSSSNVLLMAHNSILRCLSGNLS